MFLLMLTNQHQLLQQHQLHRQQAAKMLVVRKTFLP
jgi:hypothetical protein